jgi:hypothetical protein
MRLLPPLLLLLACGPEPAPVGDPPATDEDSDPVPDSDTVPEQTPPPQDTQRVVDTDDGLIRVRFDGTERSWSDGTVATSCRGYLEPGEGYALGGDDGDGVYAVDPDGSGPLPRVQVWCDQTQDGGGWMLVAQTLPSSDPGRNLCTADAVGTLDLDEATVAGPAKLANAAIDALWQTGTTREVLIKHDQDGWQSNTRPAWDRICRIDFAESYRFGTDTESSALTDLDSPDVTCSTGPSFTIVAPNNNPLFCGWSFLGGQGSIVMTLSSTVSYAGGNCGLANAGRGWLGGANFGCNAQKILVR